MPRTAAPKPEQVLADSKPTLDMFTKKIGFPPNVMATFALSPIAFNPWATLFGSLSKALDAKTRDSIGLAVSEVNGCKDCLTVHGFTAEHTPPRSAALICSEIALDEAPDAALPGMTLGQQQRTRLGSVVRLLETAGQTLQGDKEAYRCVAKAAALLQAECELGAENRSSRKRRDFLPAWKMARVLTFIDANLDRPIRIEEMASIAELSLSHFSRAFRSTAGEPPHGFVMRRRVERAAQLILLTDEPLSQIALECGMADQSHLTKVFRRSYGMGPGKWRKLQLGSEKPATFEQEWDRDRGRPPSSVPSRGELRSLPPTIFGRGFTAVTTKDGVSHT